MTTPQVTSAALLRLRAPHGTEYLNYNPNDTASLHSVNEQLHDRFRTWSTQLSSAALDSRTRTRLERSVSDLGRALLAVNSGLLYATIRPFTANDRRNAEMYEASAAAALWDAFTRFDPSKGTLYTFSKHHIRRAAAATLVELHYVGWKYSDFQNAHSVRVARAALQEKFGRLPSVEEIAVFTNLSPDTVRFVSSPPSHLSVDLRYRYPGSTRRAGTVRFDLEAPSPVQERTTPATSIEDLLASGVLTDREAYLVLTVIGGSAEDLQNLPGIASTIGLGREVVRRTRNSALEKLSLALSS